MCFFFFKQKTAYEMRISDWSSDVCSSDLRQNRPGDRVMDVRPIKTEADLDWALEEVKRYFDIPPPAGSPEADRFDVLSTLIEAYEDEHYPIPLLDQIGRAHV